MQRTTKTVLDDLGLGLDSLVSHSFETHSSQNLGRVIGLLWLPNGIVLPLNTLILETVYMVEEASSSCP
jgi:hypothetical protein